MTNQPTNPETPAKPLVVLPVTMADIMTQIALENTARANLRPANKAAVFAALAGAGIAAVNVTFDGCGDSGQIESIELGINPIGQIFGYGSVIVTGTGQRRVIVPFIDNAIAFRKTVNDILVNK